MRLICLLLCALCLTACVTVDKNKTNEDKGPAPLDPKGEFATLPFQQTRDTVDSLISGDHQTLERVLTDPNRYTPPVLFALAHRLYQQGDITPAMFWYYTAQLRARSDANKSLDPTTQQGVTELSNQFARNINRYALSHLDELAITMGHVLEWDSRTQRTYDPRWVALHGQDAYSKTQIAFKPKSEWNQIDIVTRAGFQKGFQQMMSRISNQPQTDQGN